MKRTAINALVDIRCLITFVPSLLTGLVLYFALPSGSGRGSAWATYLGITRHDWVLVHNAASFAFAVLLALHLLLHWHYFRNIRKCLAPEDPASCDRTG